MKLIGKWIDEGASFGDDARLDIEIVATKAKSDSQTHNNWSRRDWKRAEETWKLVMDEVEATSLPSANFVVIGSTTESRLTDVSHLVESLVPKIADALRMDTAQPLVKGNIAVFVFDKRYDFNEFGKMVEQRDFPKDDCRALGLRYRRRLRNDPDDSQPDAGQHQGLAGTTNRRGSYRQPGTRRTSAGSLTESDIGPPRKSMLVKMKSSPGTPMPGRQLSR